MWYEFPVQRATNLEGFLDVGVHHAHVCLEHIESPACHPTGLDDWDLVKVTMPVPVLIKQQHQLLQEVARRDPGHSLLIHTDGISARRCHTACYDNPVQAQLCLLPCCSTLIVAYKIRFTYLSLDK